MQEKVTGSFNAHQDITCNNPMKVIGFKGTVQRDFRPPVLFII